MEGFKVNLLEKQQQEIEALKSKLKEQEKLYFAVGDVKGKGIPAALYMAAVSTLFAFMAETKQSTTAICETLNDYLCHNMDEDMFITMFIGILDLQTGHLQYTNAGQTYPILRSAKTGECTFLKGAQNIPLGIMPTTFKDHSQTIARGDTILLYSDGISEAQNEKRELYGSERLLEHVTSFPLETTPENMINNILTELLNYIGEMDESDDITLLAIRLE